MTVNKMHFNEAENIVQDRYLEECKPYSFAVRNVQTNKNLRSQGEPSRKEEQSQSQQTQESAQAIALQEEPIILPDDHSTQTDRPTLNQQPQNITATVNRAEVPKKKTT